MKIDSLKNKKFDISIILDQLGQPKLLRISLHRVSIEITLTVPLSYDFSNK